MKFIIWGCGETGCKALCFLGSGRVDCFADSYGNIDDIHGKKVILIDDAIRKVNSGEELFLVIASINHSAEMESKLKCDGVEHYFVFDQNDPSWISDALPHYYLYKREITPSYTKILSDWRINRFRRIAIYGENYFLPYLITEILAQSPGASVSIISKEKNVRSLGYEVVDSLEKCKGIDCLVLNRRRSEDNIRARLSENKADFSVVDLFDIEAFEPAFKHQELEKYKNCHKGRRIFVLGNGPSLTLSDLEMLHNHHEICIAVNKIYRVYKKTNWRADYVCFSDGRVIDDCREDLKKLPGTVFVSDVYHSYQNAFALEGVQYYHLNLSGYYPGDPGFSNDMVTGFYSGWTVIYEAALQLAAYMGASQIFLMGVDHSYKEEVTDKRNHFIEDYFSANEIQHYAEAKFQKEYIEKAYRWAEAYSRKNGFRIYNATRGGELEIFERVDFDSLFALGVSEGL